MCETNENKTVHAGTAIPVEDAVGRALVHDITEVAPGGSKGRAFRRGHVVTKGDIPRLLRLGKERLFVLDIPESHMHEDEAALALAGALSGTGVGTFGEPVEGRVDLLAVHDGLLKVNTNVLYAFNLLGEVMCATLHNNTPVKQGQVVAGTRAIPLVISRSVVEAAVCTAGEGVLSVKPLRQPRAGVVITGGEVYHGRVKDAFGPVIGQKIAQYGGTVVGLHFAPDDADFVAARLGELLDAGADLLITTGGMSVDPDDVTRHAFKKLGARDITYGSAVLPGAMFLSALVDASHNGGVREVPVLGIPACGMCSKTTVFDLVLPRVLAGERIGREELAALGHGGLCLKCDECVYPACPFGK